MVSLIFAWINDWTNGWVNNREAGDLRRHRRHYDVTVMLTLVMIAISFYTAFSLCIQFLLQEEVGRLVLLERSVIHEKNLRKIRIKTFSTTHDGLWWRVLCARRGAWKYTFSYQILLGVWKWTLGGWKYKYSHQKSRAWEWLWTRGDWRCSFWYQKSQPWELQWTRDDWKYSLSHKKSHRWLWRWNLYFGRPWCLQRTWHESNVVMCRFGDAHPSQRAFPVYWEKTSL